MTEPTDRKPIPDELWTIPIIPPMEGEDQEYRLMTLEVGKYILRVGDFIRETDLTAEQMAAVVADPEAAIEIQVVAGKVYPAWQFGESGINPTVAQVNRTFDTIENSLGLAAWWLQPHSAVEGGGLPMSLLGTSREKDLLIMAWSAISEPVG